MRLLLDTHAIIWSIAEPDRLSTHARELVVDPGNHVFVSVVSAWEITIKRALGKLEFADLTDALLDRYGFEALPLELSHANRVGRLPRLHDDPFDRMLVAQAQVEGLTVVSRDRRVTAYPVDVEW
jgi:PIN domain nuclease of toxin-antitoxin system